MKNARENIIFTNNSNNAVNVTMLPSICITSGYIMNDNVTLVFQCLDRHVVCEHTNETPDGKNRPVQRNAAKNSLAVWTGSQNEDVWLLPAFLKNPHNGL